MTISVLKVHFQKLRQKLLVIEVLKILKIEGLWIF